MKNNKIKIKIKNEVQCPGHGAALPDALCSLRSYQDSVQDFPGRLFLVCVQLQPEWDHEIQLVFSRKASALGGVAMNFSILYTTLLHRNIIFSLEEMNREESS